VSLFFAASGIVTLSAAKNPKAAEGKEAAAVAQSSFLPFRSSGMAARGPPPRGPPPRGPPPRGPPPGGAARPRGAPPRGEHTCLLQEGSQRWLQLAAAVLQAAFLL
jgi:hypothetical protein